MPGILSAGSTFADVVGQYMEVKERISRLEESQSQQGAQIDQLKKEESQLKEMVDEMFKRLETQVENNTKAINSLDTAKSLVSNEEDIFTRLKALEAQVNANTEALKPKKSLEGELADSELIRSLFNQDAKLHEEIDELSHKVNMLNYQQEPAKEKKASKRRSKKSPPREESGSHIETSPSVKRASSFHSKDKIAETGSQLHAVTHKGLKLSKSVEEKSNGRVTLDKTL